MNSGSLCIQAGQYDNPILTRFLAAMDGLKIPAQIKDKSIETKARESRQKKSFPNFLQYYHWLCDLSAVGRAWRPGGGGGDLGV